MAPRDTKATTPVRPKQPRSHGEQRGGDPAAGHRACAARCERLVAPLPSGGGGPRRAAPLLELAGLCGCATLGIHRPSMRALFRGDLPEFAAGCAAGFRRSTGPRVLLSGFGSSSAVGRSVFRLSARAKDRCCSCSNLPKSLFCSSNCLTPLAVICRWNACREKFVVISGECSRQNRLAVIQDSEDVISRGDVYLMLLRSRRRRP